MYTNTRKRVALVVLGLIVASSTLVAQQYSFKVGQLYYKITDATNRKVAVVPENSDPYYPNYFFNNYPAGAVAIPATVVNGSNTYSVTSIGYAAFSVCSGLTSITIPNSVTSIGNRAFSGCRGLTSITIPNSVTSIGEGAFSSCSRLTSINIPNGVTSIGGWTFQNCSGLTSITIPSSVTSIGEGAFESCRLTSITIPNSITSIGNRAFSGCRGLTSITIPNSVTSIGEGAFESCSRLTSINIPNGVTSIGWYTFSNCSGLTSIAIPNSVTSIGKWAFSGCYGLTSITIPSSVTKIGNGTFYRCTSLASVNLSHGLDSIGSNNFYYIDKGVFEDCTSLTSISIPSSVTSIGTRAFSGCSRLTSITIPNSVTSIGKRAFSGCRGLTFITIPSSVTSIGEGAFSWCSGLSAVAVGWQIPLAIDSNVFEGVALNSVRLIVPAGRESIYRAADVWKRFSPIVETANYTITYNQSAGGIFNLKKGTQNITSGSSVMGGVELTVEATPNIGYQVDSIKVNGIRITGVSFMVQGNTTVEVFWGEAEYLVTYNQSVGGTLTVKDGTQTIVSGSSVEYGTSLTIEAIPAQGYKLDSIKVNGARIAGGSFTVDSNSTVEAYFSKMKYTVTYTQPTNGTFTVKDGTQTIVSGSSVEYGTVLTFEATPAQGYMFDNIKVNGARISGLSFTVDSNSTVEAYFSKMKYTITYTQPANGTLTVKNGSQTIHSGDVVEYGTVLIVEATPAQDYRLDSVRVNGVRISGLSFTVTSSSIVEVYFSKPQYTISYSQSAGGTFKVKNGSQEVASGSIVDNGTILTIEATSAQGYKLDSILVNGVRISGDSFTVEDNTTVEAFFSKVKHIITYNQSVGGTLTVKDGNQTVVSGSSVEYGTSLTIEAIPAQGHKFDSIRVNGTRISGLSFTVTDNTNIEVFFGKQSYTVTYNSNMYSGKIEVTRGSEIVASGSSVEYGTQLTVKAIPNPGFEVKSLTINDQAIANNFVFSISEAVEIKAVFAPATTALDEAATKPLAIYPNPVAEVLYFSAKARTIRIYDMYGTEVAHAADTDKVEVSHLPAGVYTVRADGMVAKMIKR